MSLRSYPLADSFRVGSPSSVVSAGDELQSPLLPPSGGAADCAEATPTGPTRPGPGRSRLGSTPPAVASQLPLAGTVTLLEDSPDASKGSSVLASVVILSKTIMGAGELCMRLLCRLLSCCLCGGMLLRGRYCSAGARRSVLPGGRHTLLCAASPCLPLSAAGMAALPRAFVMLGLLIAASFLLLMGYMTRKLVGRSAAGWQSSAAGEISAGS